MATPPGGGSVGPPVGPPPTRPATGGAEERPGPGGAPTTRRPSAHRQTGMGNVKFIHIELWQGFAIDEDNASR